MYLHGRRCSLLARVDAATKLDVTYKVDLCRSSTWIACGARCFQNPPSQAASLPAPAALHFPLSVCSSRCAYFSYPLFTSPSSSPVSTPSPSPTHSDIIVRIPTLLPRHTLEHRAYHTLPSTRSHISFFSFFFAVTTPPSSLFSPLAATSCFFFCFFFDVPHSSPPHSVADTQSDCHTGRLQELHARQRRLQFVTVFKCPNAGRSEMLSPLEQPQATFIFRLLSCVPLWHPATQFMQLNSID